MAKSAPSKQAAPRPQGPSAANAQSVTLLDPSSGMEVGHLFTASGTCVAGVAKVQIELTYTRMDGTPAPLVKTSAVPTAVHGTNVWTAGVPVTEDGKNGVLAAFNAAKADGGSADNLTIKAVPDIGVKPREKEKDAYVIPPYRVEGTYNPDVGSDVIGIVSPLGHPEVILKLVEASAAEGKWVMLVEAPAQPGFTTPYQLVPYLLDGRRDVKRKGSLRILA